MKTPTRGEQRQIADYLDQIGESILVGCKLGQGCPLTAHRLSLGAAYRLIAADMRELADGEN
jgi:hypothetical protein